MESEESVSKGEGGADGALLPGLLRLVCRMTPWTRFRSLLHFRRSYRFRRWDTRPKKVIRNGFLRLANASWSLGNGLICRGPCGHWGRVKTFSATTGCLAQATRFDAKISRFDAFRFVLAKISRLAKNSRFDAFRCVLPFSPLAKISRFDAFRFVALHPMPVIMLGVIGGSDTWSREPQFFFNVALSTGSVIPS